jgi:two-component system cell cycle response regulator DivK
MTKDTVILYVEDNLTNRLLVRRILEAEGYIVIEAENAREAFSFLDSDNPNLILMDINMPDIDGFTLTGQLKQRSNLQNVPIIALTANVMKGDRERTLAAGCDGYIQKPIDVDTFPNQIAQFLQEAKRESQSIRSPREDKLHKRDF